MRIVVIIALRYIARVLVKLEGETRCDTCTFVLDECEVNRRFHPDAVFPICARLGGPFTGRTISKDQAACIKHGRWLPGPTWKGDSK